MLPRNWPVSIYDNVKPLTEDQHNDPDITKLPKLPEGLVYSRTIFGRWAIIDADSKGKVHLDPAYETYWCM